MELEKKVICGIQREGPLSLPWSRTLSQLCLFSRLTYPLYLSIFQRGPRLSQQIINFCSDVLTPNSYGEIPSSHLKFFSHHFFPAFFNLQGNIPTFLQITNNYISYQIYRDVLQISKLKSQF